MTRLRNALAIAPDEPFLQLLWCVHPLQTGRADRAARGIAFPREAADPPPGSPYAIHAWELETLANQLLLTPKRPGARYYPCNTFDTAAEFVTYLRALENADFGVIRERIDIFQEMHRIGQRQLPWQRSVLNLADFYRPLYLYGQGDGAAAFAAQHGLSIVDFAKIGFALYAQFLRRPLLQGLPDMSVLGLGPQVVEAALRLIGVDHDQAAPALRRLMDEAGSSRWPTAYQPSVLRRFPLLT